MGDPISISSLDEGKIFFGHVVAMDVNDHERASVVLDRGRAALSR
ncbi:MAG: hypothetical protein V3S77_02400 [Acidiferrobacterales bacterium]